MFTSACARTIKGKKTCVIFTTVEIITSVILGGAETAVYCHEKPSVSVETVRKRMKNQDIRKAL